MKIVKPPLYFKLLKAIKVKNYIYIYFFPVKFHV